VVEAVVDPPTMPTGRRADRTEQAIETALQPGRFLAHGAALSHLEEARRIT
jgi:hypothetical protein